MLHTDIFPSEQHLVNAFLSRVSGEDRPWGCLEVAVEFFYHRGRTDVIACTASGDVIAFEAKLTRWREALQQAYRNTCFAHRSYVLMPRAAARVAAQYQVEFARRRVGLCYLVDGKVRIGVEAVRVEPIQPWLSAAAVRYSAGAALTAAS